MHRRICKSLLAALAIVLTVLSAGPEARAVTFSYEISPGGISSEDYTTSATYLYTFTQNPGSSTMSYVDFEIPKEICIPVGTFSGGTGASVTDCGNFTVTANGVQSSGEVYCLGCGDFGTKFGIGNTMYRVLKVNVPSAPSVTVALTLYNQKFAPGRQFGTAEQSEYGVVLIKAGNGANILTFELKTPTVVEAPAEMPPVISNLTVTPNPVVSTPDCTNMLTFSWDSLPAGSTVTVSNSLDESFEVPQDSNSIQVCPPLNSGVDPMNVVYTLTAAGPTGATSSVTTTVTVNPPQKLQTSCQEIVKTNPPSCLRVCSEIGGQEKLVSAELYQGLTCTGEHQDLRIFEPGVDPPLLICNPCDVAGTDPTVVDCSGNTTDTAHPPFDVWQASYGGHWIKCDIYKKEYETPGITIEIGDDPCWKNARGSVTCY